jgi:hypothetical protein
MRSASPLDSLFEHQRRRHSVMLTVVALSRRKQEFESPRERQ